MNDAAVVTGGSRGIGLAVSEELAAAGFRLAILYANREENAQRAAEKLRARGSDVEIYRCDVADKAQVREVSRQILKRFGRVDVLVNNAGIAQIKLLTDTTEDEWDRMMGVNVKGLYNTCHELVPQMVSRKYGRIINISSMWGIAGASCEVAYSATKGAVNSFTKALAKELAPSNIRVNALACGAIDTDMNSCFTKEELDDFCNDIPAGRLGHAEEIAKMAALLYHSPQYLTGEVIKIDGGYL